LAYGTRVKVTNTKNNRSVIVVINDRGPTQQGRVIDVSHAAAKRLGFTRAGLTEVKLEVVGQRAARRAKRR
jgi:rare lipoprotein A